MKRLATPALIGGLLLAVFSPLSGAAVTTEATPASGTANATSTLLSLTSGQNTISLARDEARSVAGRAPSAYALLVPGAAGATTVGKTEREATAKGSSRQSVAEHGYTIAGLIELGLTAGSVSTAIGDDVSSAVNLDLGHVDMLDGFATIDGGSSDTTTLANDSLSRVQRAITISDLHTFSLGELFQQAGASPLDLSCTAVQNLGAQIGIDTASACAQLATAGSAVDAAKTLLSGAVDDVLSAKNDLLAEIAAVTATKDPIAAQIEEKEQDRTAANQAITTAQATKGAAVAQRDTLNEQLAPLQSQQSSLESQTAGLNRTTLQAQRDAQAALCSTLLLQSLIDACNQQVASLDAQLALFSLLDSVNAQIAQKNTLIAAATEEITQSDAAIAAAHATIATLDAAIASLNASLASIDATLATLNEDLDGLVTALAMLDPFASVSATCGSVDHALTAVSNQIGSLAATMDPARATVESACAAITGRLNALMDAPLVQLDGVDIHLDAIAREGAPSILVSGTIGRVQVGGLAPVGVDLDLLGDGAANVRDLIQDKLDDVITLTGLGFPLPAFELMVTARASGKDGDGNWFARGSVTTLRIHMPSAVISLPSQPPLAVLGDGSTQIARITSRRVSGSGAHLFADSSSPEIIFDVGTFNAASIFHPATGSDVDPNNNGGNGGSSATTNDPRYNAAGSARRLPLTGVGAHGALAAFLLLGALIACRVTVVKP